MSNEKVLCDRCDHKPVCSLKAEYIAAQEAVNNVVVPLGYCNGGDSPSMKRLSHFTWIKLPELQCMHFKEFKADIRG